MNSHLADQRFHGAFDLYRNATDCRSHYSQWLVEQGRYHEALEHLKIVRERLNSNELWVREARALRGLGREEKAAAKMKEFYQRVWRERQAKMTEDF